MALSAPKNTPALGLGPVQDTFSLKQKGSTTCYPGGIAVIDAGYVKPATVATGLIAVGFFDCAKASVNSGADGAVSVAIKPGTRLCKNHGADAVVQADVGKTCYLVDDETVAKTDGTATRSAAGKVIAVSSAGVYVQIALV